MSSKRDTKKEKDVKNEKVEVKKEVKAEPGLSQVSMSQASEEFTFFGSDQSFKIGQKYPTPAPGNGGNMNPFSTQDFISNLFYSDRVFYETLYDEKPDSEMAQEWCLYYGILDEKAAKKVFDLVAKRKANKGKEVESPVKKPAPKAAATTKEPAKKETTSKKRRKVDSDDDVDDTGKPATTVFHCFLMQFVWSCSGMGDGDVWEGRGKSGI